MALETTTETYTRTTLRDGTRVVGVVVGNEEEGYRAEHWMPALTDGRWYGAYEVEACPSGEWDTVADALGWLRDRYALESHKYADRPQQPKISSTVPAQDAPRVTCSAHYGEHRQGEDCEEPKGAQGAPQGAV